MRLPQAEIVDFPQNVPPYFPGKTASLPPLKTEFADALHWDLLAIKYLGRYPIPKSHVRATSETLERWLGRMELSERAFLKMGAYRSVQDCIDLNPTWPLRALIGLALEVRDEQK